MYNIGNKIGLCFSVLLFLVEGGVTRQGVDLGGLRSEYDQGVVCETTK